MKAFILAVGDEVLCGDVVNTNAAYLAKELDIIGIETAAHSAVPDDAAVVEAELKRALGFADLIITTGGLGPTKDDLTKEAVCEALGLAMVEDTELTCRMKEMFARRGMQCTPNNLKQCAVPAGSRILANANGTAPGIYAEKNGKTVIMLPGPPAELEPMFYGEALPLLAEKTEKKFAEKYYMTAGRGESILEQAFRDGGVTADDYSLNTYITKSGVMVKTVAHAADAAAAQALIEAKDARVRELLGDIIYSERKEELWEYIGRTLLEKHITFAAAESCTGGLVTELLTSVAGISDVLVGSCVCYTNAVKMKTVGVKKETLDEYTAVSRQTALEMSRGISESYGSDIGLGITGLAGPGGGTPNIPVGRVYISVSFRGKNSVYEFTYGGSRARVRARAAADALLILKKVLDEA